METIITSYFNDRAVLNLIIIKQTKFIISLKSDKLEGNRLYSLMVVYSLHPKSAVTNLILTKEAETLTLRGNIYSCFSFYYGIVLSCFRRRIAKVMTSWNNLKREMKSFYIPFKLV